MSGEHSAARRATAETRGGDEPGRKSRTAAVAGTSSMASCAKRGNHDGAEGWLESPGGRIEGLGLGKQQQQQARGNGGETDGEGEAQEGED